MNNEEMVSLKIKVNIANRDEVLPLQVFAFTGQGKLLGSAPLEQDEVEIEVPAELDGRHVEVILGPRIEEGQSLPSAAGLKRMGAYAQLDRFLIERPQFAFDIPGHLIPLWCLCPVRGRLVKRITLLDGTTVQRPVCNARVHICEVDRIPIIINLLPDPLIWRLRDDLLDKLQVIPKPILPRPEPDPRLLERPISTRMLTLAEPQQHAVTALVNSEALSQLRRQLGNLSDLIIVNICDLPYLWPYFSLDCLTTVEVDGEGRFSTVIVYDCNDKPDLYFWVEQFQEAAWQTVYRPSVGCGTYWNYGCSSEIVINVPRAIACEKPTYDVPPGVSLFVVPWAIGLSPIWGKPAGATPAPNGWVRPDGYINYHTGSSLGMLYNAPFGGVLNFIHDDSYFISSSGIKYYRYSYRRAGSVDWIPIQTPLSRGYRMEVRVGAQIIPKYAAYPVGPFVIGGESGLFEFKPRTPPALSTDPPNVVIREWLGGNLGEVAARWDTRITAPPLSEDNVSDDAGDFEVKIEVFDPDGNKVEPGPSTFRFLVRNPDGTSTRLATSAEISDGAYLLNIHIDNNRVEADLPQPSIDGVSASNDCGFLNYGPADLVHIQYLAAHPNDHAVFAFGIKRGSNPLASASTLAPYVEVAAPSAPTSTTPYHKLSGYYQRDFTPIELVGSCVDAAFAASLHVYGKATNGSERLSINASRLIAFALAEEETDEV